MIIRYAPLAALILLSSIASAADPPPPPARSPMRYEPAYPLQTTPCDQQDIWCTYREHNPNNSEFPNLRDLPENYDDWQGLYNRTWGFNAWRRYGQGWGNPGDGVMGPILMGGWKLYNGWGLGPPDPAKEPHLSPFTPHGELEGVIGSALAEGATVCNGKLDQIDAALVMPGGKRPKGCAGGGGP